ncbi:hypothetical protein NHL51_04300 [Leucobacter sp. gxy201]|uniref:hypothetical protein n=1 Tax=Leucobacter sp. gxy201 TaxID=2957200 RepID=UPI003DA0089C
MHERTPVTVHAPASHGAAIVPAARSPRTRSGASRGTALSEIDAARPARLRLAARRARRAALLAYEAHTVERSAESHRAALEAAHAARAAEATARAALYDHRKALARAARDSRERAALSFQDLILLALAVRRDTPHLPGPLGVPGLRRALILAVYLVRAMLELSRAAGALRLRDYLPPPPEALSGSPLTAARTLMLAPGAPSRTVCV